MLLTTLLLCIFILLDFNCIFIISYFYTDIILALYYLFYYIMLAHERNEMHI